MSVSERVSALLAHLASRPGHDEVKADFRDLLVEEFDAALHDIRFEQRIEVRSRTDALIGRTVFEAKRDLVAERGDVERKMPDYLANREQEEGERFVGLASDGRLWIAYELVEGALVEVRRATLDPERPVEFLAFLDGVLALKASLPTDELTLKSELGQDSVAYRRAARDLEKLWASLKDDPAVALKRQLWAQLLTLVYGKDVESDALFVQHTFLVIVAKAIAGAVLEIREDDPARLLSGEAFQAAGIYGAVESDFFDWIVAAPEGAALVRRILAHVRRFRLREARTDVLKTLYESLIDRAERHGLGEYYTPDWLAAKVVKNCVSRPLEQTVLDPACGSGAFLFHAIRLVLAEAEDGDLPEAERAGRTTELVAGMDIHPVAVIIARVTYLLALAPVLHARKGSISIPVYLGDALQLSITDVMGLKELTVRVPPAPDGTGATKLDFPDVFCRDAGLFDKAIEVLRSGSESGASRDQVEYRLVREIEMHYMRDLTAEERDAVPDMGTTYETFDRLRREGRDSVWAYVARNLSRPLAFSHRGGWASVLVGNPPWVAFRHMSEGLQKRFRELARGERVHVGGRFATQNDLCALFAVRAAGLYLRASGRLGLVLPLAVLTRGQFEKLRGGSFDSLRIHWDEAWVMDRDVEPLFPVPSCAVFGRRRAIARPIPTTVRRYSGGLAGQRDAPEEVADRLLTVVENAPAPSEARFEGGSPYRKLFRQGATLVPRMLVLVERRSLGKLGSNTAKPAVTSRRSSQEKEPWKSAPGVEHPVEAEFLRPVLLGESVLPYRIGQAFEGVVPVTDKGELLDAEGAANRGYDGITGWMRAAERTWKETGESPGMTLIGRWNYHNELGSQFPISPLRVVYAKAGSQPAACVVRDTQAVIDHKLYWFAPASEDEAHFLAALVNSETTRARSEHLQSRGLFGARDFDKVVWSLPIPRFDPAVALHREIAAAAREAEALAAAVPLPDAARFQRARALVRTALADAGLAARIDALVARLLDGAGAG
ncbi:N-6 DNA methylase [Salinarimonas chemoclinalis]|uniref:N-6 DNA methylase n=1 Tax=Salinarimonas chemoclinalis TaxID=3241599 RepID=UPI00355934AD